MQMDVSAEKMIFGVAGIDPGRRAELIKMLLDTQAVKTILLKIPSLGRQNVASILIFSQSFGGTLHLTDWETKGEKLKKMGLGVPALPFTFVAHLLAVAAIVMVLLWNIHFRVSGVPPDAFCETGQLWGSPLYDWNAMEKEGYSWWICRIRLTLKLKIRDKNGHPVSGVNTSLRELQASNSETCSTEKTARCNCTPESSLPWIVRYRLAILFFVSLA
ncbi:hypothetical protein S83_056111, partial [Arachis hypogaea]